MIRSLLTHTLHTVLGAPPLRHVPITPTVSPSRGIYLKRYFRIATFFVNPRHSSRRS